MKFRFADVYDTLNVYLSWEGIIGYTDELMDFQELPKEDLEAFLEEEGIFDYTNAIYDILQGEDAYCRDMEMEDFMDVCDDCDVDPMSDVSESLNEAIPKDVARATMNSNNKRGNLSNVDSNIDWENTSYKPISPAEAAKIIKSEGSDNLRIVIGGKIVKLNDKNTSGWKNSSDRSDHRFRVDDVGGDKAYVRKNGQQVLDTGWMPVKHILDIADKIYYTNEGQVLKDPTVQSQRQTNPEHNYRAASRDLGRNKMSLASLHQTYSNIRANLKDKLKSGEITQQEYESAMADAKNDFKDAYFKGSWHGSYDYWDTRGLRNRNTVKDRMALNRNETSRASMPHYAAAMDRAKTDYADSSTSASVNAQRANALLGGSANTRRRGEASARSYERAKTVRAQLKDLRAKIKANPFDQALIREYDDLKSQYISDSNDHMTLHRGYTADMKRDQRSYDEYSRLAAAAQANADSANAKVTNLRNKLNDYKSKHNK